MVKKQLNKRTLIFLSIAAILLIVIICDQMLFNSSHSTSGSLHSELTLKKELFTKYSIEISKKDEYEKQLIKLKDAYNSYEKKLIKSKTEDLAQAKLQDYVKSVARKSGLIISRSSAQKVEIINDKPRLMLVYARVEINDIDAIKKLKKFLYNIEYNGKKLVLVNDLRIKGTGFTTTKGVSATIKLSAIAKIEAKASGKRADLQSEDGRFRESIALAGTGELGNNCMPAPIILTN